MKIKHKRHDNIQHETPPVNWCDLSIFCPTETSISFNNFSFVISFPQAMISLHGGRIHDSEGNDITDDDAKIASVIRMVAKQV